MASAVSADRSAASPPRRLVLLAAAGRDFHNFNVVYRDDPDTEVVAFTAAQIPGIAGRRRNRRSLPHRPPHPRR